MRIAAGIISLILGAMILFQSCAVGGLGAIVAPESKAGALGMFTGFLLLIAGAFAFQLPKVAMIVSVVAAIFAFAESANDFKDMKVWGVFCLGLAVMEFFAARKPKKPISVGP